MAKTGGNDLFFTRMAKEVASEEGRSALCYIRGAQERGERGAPFPVARERNCLKSNKEGRGRAGTPKSSPTGWRAERYDTTYRPAGGRPRRNCFMLDNPKQLGETSRAGLLRHLMTQGAREGEKSSEIASESSEDYNSF